MLPRKLDAPDLDLRTFGDVEGQVHGLGTAVNLLDLRLHLGELVALLGVHVADDAGDAPHQPLIDERIEPDLDALLLQLLVDLRLLDLLRSRRSRRS